MVKSNINEFYTSFLNIVSTEEKLCPPHEFHCPENKCISSSKRCDGIKDCTEGADELNCGKFISSL